MGIQVAIVLAFDEEKSIIVDITEQTTWLNLVGFFEVGQYFEVPAGHMLFGLTGSGLAMVSDAVLPHAVQGMVRCGVLSQDLAEEEC